MSVQQRGARLDVLEDDVSGAAGPPALRLHAADADARQVPVDQQQRYPAHACHATVRTAQTNAHMNEEMTQVSQELSLHNAHTQRETHTLSLFPLCSVHLDIHPIHQLH